MARPSWGAPREGYEVGEANRFFGACGRGDLERVATLAEEGGIDPELPRLGWSPLAAACHQGQLPVVRMLVEQLRVEMVWRGVQAAAPMARLGRSPLGATTSLRWPALWSPFYAACEAGQLHVAEYLQTELGMEAVGQANASCCGWSPLAAACRNGHLPVARMLVERMGVDPARPGANGWTPIYAACEAGQLATARWLVERTGRGMVDPGAPLDTPTAESPFWIAAARGRLAVVRWLAEALALEIERPSADGQTPLQAARTTGARQVASYLEEIVRHGALLLANQRLALAMTLPPALGADCALWCLPQRFDGGGDLHDLVAEHLAVGRPCRRPPAAVWRCHAGELWARTNKCAIPVSPKPRPSSPPASPPTSPEVAPRRQMQIADGYTAAAPFRLTGLQ
jgi:ankyrin repeat protein